MPDEFREYIKNKLDEYGVKKMNDEDENNFKSCGDYFFNKKYSLNHKLSTFINEELKKN